MDIVIHFLNHIADINVSKHERLINALFFSGLPLLMAVFIVCGLMRFFRGSIVKLNICIALLIIFSGVLPALLLIHSLIYLGKENQIFLASLLLTFMCLLCACLVSEYYPMFKFKTNELYRQHTFIDGSKIELKILKPKKILILNTLFLVVHIIAVFGIILYFWRFSPDSLKIMVLC